MMPGACRPASPSARVPTPPGAVVTVLCGFVCVDSYPNAKAMRSPGAARSLFIPALFPLGPRNPRFQRLKIIFILLLGNS